MSRALKVFGFGLLAISLAGCGVRGSLESPANVKSETTADANSGQGKAETEPLKAHKAFVLDGLLR